MSPKILTLIAGASLGLLMSAACTVTSVDDDGSGGTGTGAGTTTNSGGSGTGGDATGGTGTGGDATGGSGGGETCLGCADYLAGASDDPVCGVDANNDCEPGSDCENFVDVFTCACVDDGGGTPACEAECQDGGMDLCTEPGYVPPSAACQACIDAACAGPLSTCL